MTDSRRNSARRKTLDRYFAVFGWLATSVGMLTLAALILQLSLDGFARLNVSFFTAFPSRFPERAGILSAWVGTCLVMLVTAAAAVPMGIAAGVYLEEYAPKNWVTDVIEINITNLAGVPSIVYGLLALGLFVYAFGLGQNSKSILAQHLANVFFAVATLQQFVSDVR